MSDPNESIPERIGRFAIRGVIGRGGMGVVYSAEDAETLERVAVKTVLVAKGRYAYGVRREIHALSLLRHPAIVAIVDEGMQDGAPWYAMQFVDGVTLRAYRRVLRASDGVQGGTSPAASGSFLDALRAGVSTAGLDTEGENDETATRMPVSGSRGGASGLAARPLPPPEVEAPGDETMTKMPGSGSLARASGLSALLSRAPVEDVDGDTASRPGRVDWRSTRAPMVNTDGAVQQTRRLNPLPAHALAQALSIVRQICHPLAYLHGEGLVHRDLKPENILVRNDGVPVLLDFGLVSQAGGRFGRDALDELIGMGGGTAPYMPPEQVRGDLVDARADLYALGCILYELLAGRPPFSGSLASIVHQHLTAKPAPLASLVDGVSPELDQLVGRLLAKEPRARIGRATDLAVMLERMGADGSAYPLAPEPQPYVYRPRLAGRGSILRVLVERLDALESKRGSLVLMAGESGMGKTRLALEVGRLSSDRDLPIVTGECTPGGGRPLGPFRPVLQRVADRCREEGQSTTTTLLGGRGKVLAAFEPSFTTLPGLSELPDPDPLPQPLARKRLLDSLLDTLELLSAEGGLVVILDDLQWADELTLAFLEHIVAAMESGRKLSFFMLGSYRAEETPRQIQALRASPSVLSVELTNLEDDAVSEIIGDVLGAVESPAQLTEFVTEWAGGNPFVVTEYARAAVEDRLIEHEGGGLWVSRAPVGVALPLPNNLSDLVARRLRGLSEGAAAIVAAAAVLGRHCDVGVIEEMSGLDEDALLAPITELKRKQILEESSDGGLRFIHDKLSEYTYASIDDARRTRLHHDAALGIEKRLPERVDELAEALARHFEGAGVKERAVHYLLIAGDRGRAVYAHELAERCYEKAVALLEELGDRRQAAKTLMKLGLVFTAAFDGDRARAAYERAFELWRNAGDDVSPFDDLPPATLHIAAGDPVSLDPARSYDTDSSFFQVQLFEGLVELDEDHNVLPAAAERWEVSQDSRRYRFFLRPGAEWSDGRPVLAADFEFAWKRNLHPKTRSPAAQLLYVIENAQAFHEGTIDDASLVGVEAIERDVLEVRLRAPTAFLPHLLSHPITYPQPYFAIREHGPRWIQPQNLVTNGPYVLEERTPKERILLTRNPGYNGRFPGNAMHVECRVFSHYPDALAAYERGDVDVLDLISANAEVLTQARTQHGDELTFVPLLSTNYLVLNTDRFPLDDVHVRKALALTVDRAALDRELAGTEHQTARGGFVPPGLPSHTPGLSLPYDPEIALSFLQQGGYPSGDALPTMTWLHTHGLGDPTFIEVLKAPWEAVLGVRIQVEHVQWEEFSRRIQEDPPHFRLSAWVADYPDPDNFLRAVFHSTEGDESDAWSDPRFDELVERAAAVTNPITRLELYHQADHQVTAEAVAIIPLSYGRNALLVRPRVLQFPKAASYLRYLKQTVVAAGIG